MKTTCLIHQKLSLVAYPWCTHETFEYGPTENEVKVYNDKNHCFYYLKRLEDDEIPDPQEEFIVFAIKDRLHNGFLTGSAARVEGKDCFARFKGAHYKTKGDTHVYFTERDEEALTFNQISYNVWHVVSVQPAPNID